MGGGAVREREARGTPCDGDRIEDGLLGAAAADGNVMSLLRKLRAAGAGTAGEAGDTGDAGAAVRVAGGLGTGCLGGGASLASAPVSSISLGALLFTSDGFSWICVRVQKQGRKVGQAGILHAPHRDREETHPTITGKRHIPP